MKKITCLQQVCIYILIITHRNKNSGSNLQYSILLSFLQHFSLKTIVCSKQKRLFQYISYGVNCPLRPSKYIFTLCHHSTKTTVFFNINLQQRLGYTLVISPYYHGILNLSTLVKNSKFSSDIHHTGIQLRCYLQ